MYSYLSSDDIYSELLNSNRKLIVWGTGAAYQSLKETFSELNLSKSLAYFIDSDKNKHGMLLDGHLVCSPEMLLTEDIHKVVIVVLSMYYSEISTQIAKMGFFLVVPPQKLMLGHKIYKIKNNHEIAQRKKVPSSKNVIIVQGGLYKDLTLLSCKLYATIYPCDTIILSTWEDEDQAMIDSCRKYVDIVLLNKKPERYGSQNRNLMIESTKNALLLAKDLNLEMAIKLRSDMLLDMPEIFEHFTELSTQYDSTIAHAYGLKGRILMTAMFTRAYMRYHLSDMFMLGYVDDLLKVWDIPLDERIFDYADRACKMEIHTYSFEYCMKNFTPSECYVAHHFCHNIGRELKDTLYDHFCFIRDLFIVYDDPALHLFWYKNPLGFKKLPLSGNLTCITYNSWLKLYKGEQFDNVFPSLNTSNITYGEFFGYLGS